jgi:predicted nucleic acid-binding protein
MPFVLDCSVTMAWLLGDEGTDQTIELLQSLETDEAVVPQLWGLEVANVLVVASRRGRVSEEERPRMVSALDDLPIEVDPFTHSHALSATLRLAAQLGISAYDAAYLELAMRRSLPLATLDSRLSAACRQAGATLVWS